MPPERGCSVMASEVERSEKSKVNSTSENLS
jgi:hypothetical protein